MDGRDVRAHGRVLTVYVGLLSVDWCALPCLSVLSPPPLLSHSTRALLLVTAILGGFFVVNLFLAVIFDEFMRAQAAEECLTGDLLCLVQPPEWSPPVRDVKSSGDDEDKQGADTVVDPALPGDPLPPI